MKLARLCFAGDGGLVASGPAPAGLRLPAILIPFRRSWP
jgi:hypothetical protein